MSRIRTHPGDVLREEYPKPLGLSADALATAAIAVPANRISELVRGRRGMTADIACRLGSHSRTTPEFSINLQSKAGAETDYTTLAEADYG